MLAPRFKNYFRSKSRYKESDELPWVRIGGLSKLELPRPIVLINGAFDLLHASHMRLIAEARTRGETLVCALDSDDRVKASKGPSRPIMSFIERATTLGYMPIDYLVEIDSDREFLLLLQAIRPDLRVQGDDYRRHTSKYPEFRKLFVRDSGLRTSAIIERILNASKS